jgi:hypothetical protein
MLGDILLFPRQSRFATRSSSSGRALAAFVARSSFKIADDESPRPMDRVFINYNYYNNVDPSGRAPGAGQTNVNREVFGFEKAFMDSNASFGMRVPFSQDNGPNGRDLFGDISFLFKYAVYNDCKTGDVLAGGLVLTAPTSGLGITNGSDHISDWLFQPWVGGTLNCDRMYGSFFSSILVPSDSADSTILFNDIAIGYFIRRDDCQDALFTAIIPTLEAHITTPLNHRGTVSSAFGVPDIFDLTAGAHLVCHQNLWLTVGGCVPLSGPRPFDFEVIAQLNYRF